MSIRTLGALLATTMLFAVAPASALAQASASPYTTGFRYDAAQRLVGGISPDPDGGGSLLFRATRNTYDSAGRLTKVETGTLSSWQSEAVAPSAWSGFTVLKRMDIGYDSRGRRIREISYGGGAAIGLTQYSYSDAGLYDCVAVRMNLAAFQSNPLQFSLTNNDACAPTTPASGGDPDRITRTDYFADRQVKKVTSGYAVQPMVVRENTYTDNGRLKTEADGEQNATLHEYDPYDRPRRTYYPSSAKNANAHNPNDYDEYGYDNNSNRTSWRRRDGGTITTTYDALNRPSTKTTTATAMTSGSSFSYAYDNFGNPTSVSDGTRTTTRSYDALSRLTWEQDNALGAASRVSYEYDVAGRRTKLIWPDSFFVTYDYDNTDALTAIRRAGSGSASDRIAGFSYDDLGRRVSVTRGDNKVTTSYAYNASDLRLQSLTQTPSSSGNAVSFSFAYNTPGQVTLRTISNAAYVWANPSGTSIDRPYGTDGLNRIVDIGTSGQSGYNAYGYDGRGNLVCIAAAAPACTNPTIRYFYDVESRLRGTTAGASLSYDPQGRLFSSTTVGNTTTRYLYDGPNVIGEYNSSGTLLRRYVFGDGADEVLARYSGSGTTPEYLLADHQGSIIAATDSNGAVTSKLTYDEYGVPGSGNAGLFQYTGQVYLSDLSLYHYKARVYSPTLGRFLQTDPTGYDDGLNWYAYVGNDPLNRSDPTGNLSEGLTTGSGSICGVGDNCSTIILSGDGGDGGGGNSSGSAGTLVLGAAPMGHNGGPPLEGVASGCAANPILCGVLAAAAVTLKGDTARTPTDRIIQDHLTAKDLDAARRELRGEVVARRWNGTPYDHVKEVRDAQNGLYNEINLFKRVLSRPNLSPENRAFYEAELSKASKALDYSKQFVPR
ncbi:polymorphic toxin type 28 domain-containing protein [Caulobacter segnis]|uniref:polymorphic toxin type 28 domain-containing protein n=1 Tax=Caulobacter segnis TaxID=88688 RepID=UPI002864AE78|nr:polymorphic toxin type 28 domain-containing protein [Caulobacter segnis]MDR6624346.1 RHS repeat-associated protein [Caulobacter segnis]